MKKATRNDPEYHKAQHLNTTGPQVHNVSNSILKVQEYLAVVAFSNQ